MREPNDLAEGQFTLRYPKLAYDLWRYRGEPGQLIPLLQAAQDAYSYVPEHAIARISGVTGISESDIYGVITFYKQFRLRPMGKHLIRICDGTACHVNGAGLLRDVLADELHLESGDTTEDGLFTLQPVACLGCCSLAPAMMIGEETFGRLTAQSIRRILRKFK
ncbi:MAG: NADH-quinone oxidoreductase subunit NuoE [Myxococcales bacterium]